MNTLTTHPVRRSRGQALVLSALGMVLLVLMVCMTLSFGTKAKAKMEVQVVADQAAYSTAVAVARSFNVISMVNRVMMAHMTAMLGIQSAISFAGNWAVTVQILLIYYTLEIANQLTCCNWGCLFYGCVTAFIVFITRWLPTLLELLRLFGTFMGLDMKAADQARRTGFANVFLYGGQLMTVSAQLYGALNNQKVTKNVMNKAKGGVADWTVSSGGDKVAKRETGFLFGPIALGVGAVMESNLILMDRHAVVASMGSRGSWFTANRFTWMLPNGVRSMMQSAYGRIGARNDWRTRPLHNGHGQFGTIPHDDAIMITNSRFAMADDHDMGVFRYSGPAARRPLVLPFLSLSFVMSNNVSGFHFAGIFSDNNHMLPQPTATLCLLNCPSAWTNFVDYNPILVADWRDNFMQPKSPVTVSKNAAAAAPDPFNLFFNYRFSSSGPGETFDLRHGSGPGGGGLIVRDGAGTANISDQMGYSTGITYYHRAGHWAEPPNFFNAYWRAGLTRPDIDRAAGSISFLGLSLSPDNSHDIEDTLRNSGAGWAASAYEELYSRGYQGIAP